MSESTLPPSGEPIFAGLDRLVREKKIIVLCGAGGVGKTTTSAALALAGAQAGKRVLVLTIDPAKRLAEALGIPLNAPRPVPVPKERLAACGLEGPGSLDAWMLDPRAVFERLILKLASAEKAQTILQSRMYRHVSELVAGMQEYMAVEALYEGATEQGYDLVVLDTPPSRNALDFLDAPGRLTRMLEEGVIQMFVPKEGGLLARAGRLVGGVFARVFGEEFVTEMQAFIGAFSSMFGSLRSHTEGVRQLLSSDGAAFLLVTSTEEEALREALYFRDQIQHRQLPFAGFVLNRSYARLDALPHPHDAAGTSHLPPLSAELRRKLGLLADEERAQAQADGKLLERLKALAGGRLAVAAPHLGEAVEDLPGLLRLARGIAG